MTVEEVTIMIVMLSIPVIGNILSARRKTKKQTKIYDDYEPTSYKYNIEKCIVKEIDSSGTAFLIGQIVTGRPNYKIEGIIKSGEFLKQIEVKDNAGNILGNWTNRNHVVPRDEKFEFYFKAPQAS